MGGIVTRMAARKARKQGTKVFYTAHGFHFYKGAPKKNWLVFYPIEKLFSRITDTLITITHEDYALASKKFHCRTAHMYGVGVDEQRYRAVSQEEREAVRQQLGFGKQQKILLCIGELLPNKNQAMAVRMMEIVRKKHPDAMLLLAGNGPQRENLEQLTEKLELQQNVRFLGYCTDLEKYQHAADLLVSCSKREGLPLNIVEAMLSGNPVVATQNRGHRELVQPEETGYLVDVNDTEAMAQAVLELLGDAEKRCHMGMNAAVFAKQYGFANVKQALEAIYFG
jgi:glycosyltransferase EpsD